MKELFESFEEVQAAIEEIGSTEEGEKYCADFEELYYKTLVNCERIIREEEPLANINPNMRNNGEILNSSTGSNQMPLVNSLLPPSVKLAALSESVSSVSLATTMVKVCSENGNSISC